jgi:mannose-6-phosphate isomerase-like protein (cupin superfamily)
MNGIQPFRYERPALTDEKVSVRLTGTEFLDADVQVIQVGGSPNLHSHTGNDAIWFVLSGQARFYGEAAEPIAELSTHEGVLIPHDTPYWFESVGDFPCEMLHVTARTKAEHDKRISHRP